MDQKGRHRQFYTQWGRKESLLFLLAVVSLAIQLGISRGTPFHLHHDTLRGFEAGENFYGGGHFNELAYPQKGERDADISKFLSWWTPGQYFFPMLLEKALGIKRSVAVSLLALAAFLSIFGGISALFRYLGFSPFVLLFVCLLVIWHPALSIQFFEYTGGSLLLPAILFWYVLWLLKTRLSYTALSVIFPLFSLLGFFCKSSFALFALGGAIFLFYRLSRGGFVAGKMAALLAGAALFGFSVLLYNSLGSNPAQWTLPGGFFDMGDHPAADLFLAPVLSFFSGWGLTDAGLELYRSGITGKWVYWLLVPALGAAIFFFSKIRAQKHSPDYLNLLLLQTLLFAVLFGRWYVTDKAVSYEGRHFFPLGILWLPLILEQLRCWNSRKIVLSLVLFSAVLYGFLRFAAFAKTYEDSFASHDGTAFPSRYENGFRTLRHADTTLPEGALFVIRDNWNYMPAVRDHRRLCITERSGEREPEIHTGIPKGGKVSAKDVRWERYGELFIFLPPDSEPWIPPGFEISEEGRPEGDLRWIRCIRSET